ncbi:hypothetical protein BT63DRAFT_418272 [Microthyrium microscopicum]|uniref:Uncharacterized protein n=1 Tax=Microthyrium microscopicum TaxID=703497 RepID=A0A6A6TVM5_9PEZI|nr:hypothetical protein BT63DRAFT_418272 [Microthyrium microscopicum]
MLQTMMNFQQQRQLHQPRKHHHNQMNKMVLPGRRKKAPAATFNTSSRPIQLPDYLAESAQDIVLEIQQEMQQSSQQQAAGTSRRQNIGQTYQVGRGLPFGLQDAYSQPFTQPTASLDQLVMHGGPVTQPHMYQMHHEVQSYRGLFAPPGFSPYHRDYTAHSAAMMPTLTEGLTLSDSSSISSGPTSTNDYSLLRSQGRSRYQPSVNQHHPDNPTENPNYDSIEYNIYGQPIVPCFAGYKFGNENSIANPINRSAVLCQETIWCVQPEVPWYPQANWPCHNEQVWEGDSRLSTEGGRFRRMPPIPRLPPGWPGYNVDYKENGHVEAFPFDKTWIVPTEEDIIAPVDEIEDEDIINHLLGESLVEAMS